VSGQELFSAVDTEQSCGTVVQTAVDRDGRWLCIASLQTQSADNGVLHAGSPDGPALQVLALPYPLLEDI
jgi:hypothetical protein